MVFRPALLPEDARFIGGSMAEIQALLPRLERWLSQVFRVMGGFMAGAGALTVFVAATAVPPRNRGTGAAPALLWFSGVVCYWLRW